MEIFLAFLKYVYSFLESKTGYQSFGRNSIVKHPYRIWNKKNIWVGRDVFIAEYAFLAVSRSFKNQKFNPSLVFGNNVRIGSNVFISCINNIKIDNDVIISDRVFISDNNHEFKDIRKPVINQPLRSHGNVLIESGAFVGVNAVIMPGVTIGKNSVVGASSVVTKSIPDYCVAAGVPAKIIEKYDHKKKKWVKI